MLIIGHRGARGIKPENTIESLRAGLNANVDMIEIDVRLTKDGVPILIHDMHLWRTHKLPYLVNRMTYAELEKRTSNSVNPVATLEAVLKEFGGKILLNLELKNRGTADKIIPLLKKHIVKSSDWEGFLFSSFHSSELKSVRTQTTKAQLAKLHWYNPLSFMFIHKKLNLTAVGFHRLHINSFVLEVAHKLDLFAYAFTVNRPETARRLRDMGLDGVVTDYPDVMRHKLQESEK